MKYILSLLAIVAFSISSFAQKKDSVSVDTVKPKSGTSLTLGTGGLVIKNNKDTVEHFFEVQYGLLDIGVNTLQDNSDYANPDTRNFLGVDNAYANKDLFSLRSSKSINVNVYPVLLKANLLRKPGQKLILTTGIGLQLYNFRFTKPVSYRNDPQPYVALDTISSSKNKLALNYLTIPLMLTSKTRLSKHGDKGKGIWLVYGAGVSGGYLLQSWTKQVSDERGKDKNHDRFNFSKTNMCVNAEIGLDGFFRLFGSYQVTALHENALDQHPVSIGIRFFGI